MDECERLEQILAVVDELASRATRGAIILVEGPRDRVSLEALGVHGRIVLTSQKQLFNLAEKVSGQGEDIIILSDWDERGDEVARNAGLFLKSNGARPDGELRKKLISLSRKEIKDVENLHGYVERLRSACEGKPQHY
jgi:5S rRNA maturation endonuclease (ribonuclease M5)